MGMAGRRRRDAGPAELGPFAKGSPGGHALAPGEVGGMETARRKSGEDLVGGEDPELLLLASDVDLHDLLIGVAEALASLAPLSPSAGRKARWPVP